MPLNLRALPLEPDPESVKEARAWVREVLERLDREDIVETAELGVSELVTNAMEHGARGLVTLDVAAPVSVDAAGVLISRTGDGRHERARVVLRDSLTRSVGRRLTLPRVRLRRQLWRPT